VEVVTTVADARKRIATVRSLGLSIGLVPTMGALHEGHLSLIRRARAECGFAVATIFVNPTQFGPNEDLARYPRDLEGDSRMAEAAGADMILAPPVEEVYRPGATTWVEVEGLTDRFEGAARPGHFRGVATVVAKLFNMTLPDRVYFGLKDYQQLQVIRRMARDLDFPLEVVSCETVREPDGLALSSRNRYLSDEQRRAAQALSRALFAARDRFRGGERDGAALLMSARAVLDTEPGVELGYLELADAENLTPVSNITAPAVLLVAAKVGMTRLIDNVVLDPG
jgi:pantoate--beta-alanine ligase